MEGGIAMLKILCAGMQRTGTSSLSIALQQLGYVSVHCAPTLINFYDPPDDWDVFGEIEAISDGPFWYFWREIYSQHHCKIILTFRDKDRWFDSLARHIGAAQSGDPASNFVLWGHGHPHRRRWTERFEKHCLDVIAEVDTEDLLAMDITAGDGWEVLCPFLDKPIPETPFPNIP
jgi:hypothetical protein